MILSTVPSLTRPQVLPFNKKRSYDDSKQSSTIHFAPHLKNTPRRVPAVAAATCFYFSAKKKERKRKALTEPTDHSNPNTRTMIRYNCQGMKRAGEVAHESELLPLFLLVHHCMMFLLCPRKKRGVQLQMTDDELFHSRTPPFFSPFIFIFFRSFSIVLLTFHACLVCPSLAIAFLFLLAETPSPYVLSPLASPRAVHSIISCGPCTILSAEPICCLKYLPYATTKKEVARNEPCLVAVLCKTSNRL